MTVSTELSHEEYVGNGVTTDFDFRFRIFESRHLIVVVADSDGNEKTLKNGTDYTIVGAGSYHGGKVVLNKPLAQGWKILLERDLPVVQETDLRNQGKFFAEVHEDAFDYLTMLIQKALGTFSLSLRKPTYLSNYYDAKDNRIANLAPPKLGTDAVNKDYVDNSIKDIDSKTLRVKDKPINALPNTEQRANKILAFDDNGQPITVLPESGSASDVLIELAKPTGVNLIDSGNLLIYKKIGKFGDGGIVEKNNHSIMDNDGYWYVYSGPLPYRYGDSHDDNWINVGLLNGYPVNSVENYGAIGDGRFDNSSSINLAIINNHKLKRETIFGGGIFAVSTPIYVQMGTHYSKHGTTIKGQGIEQTVIQSLTTELTDVITTPETGIIDRYNLVISDLSIKGYPNTNTTNAIRLKTACSRVKLSRVRMEYVNSGFYSEQNFWVNEIIDSQVSECNYGFRMGISGTTNRFDTLFVFGAISGAYVLRTIYSSVGSLAADDCIGDSIYDFRFCNLSVGSLGVESPSGVLPNNIINIDNSENVSIDNITCWLEKEYENDVNVIKTGTCRGAKINGILVSSISKLIFNGKLINGYAGEVSISNIVFNNVELISSGNGISLDKLKINTGLSSVSFEREYGKPLLSGGRIPHGVGFPTNIENRHINNIYTDSSSHPRYGILENDSENPAPDVGDVFLCNSPEKYGLIGYVCTQKGSAIYDSKFGFIPVITNTKPTNPTMKGIQYFDEDENKLKYWDGERWV